MVMLILTYGCVAEEDREPLVTALANAAACPLTIIIAGIGQEDMSYLTNIPEEVRMYRRMRGITQEELQLRDIVKFTSIGMNFNDPVKMNFTATMALSGIPREIIGFYQGEK